MTDRERLVRRLYDWGTVEAEALADYLLANGVVVPPCKVGTRVYVITSQTSDNRNLYIFEDTITHYRICDGYTIMCLENHLGVPAFNWDNVFLTHKEAEKALADKQANCVIAQYIEDCKDCGFCGKENKYI